MTKLLKAVDQDYFAEKASQIDQDTIYAFGIKLCSRYAKVDEMISMLRFAHSAAARQLNTHISHVFYDSKGCSCHVYLKTPIEDQVVNTIANSTVEYFHYTEVSRGENDSDSIEMWQLKPDDIDPPDQGGDDGGDDGDGRYFGCDGYSTAMHDAIERINLLLFALHENYDRPEGQMILQMISEVIKPHLVGKAFHQIRDENNKAYRQRIREIESRARKSR